MYRMVGRSIAIYPTRDSKRQGKYTAEVRYRGYGLTYSTICVTYRMVSVQQTNLFE